jgi:hypothetical protein
MEMPRQSGAFEEASSPIRVFGAAGRGVGLLYGQNLHATPGREVATTTVECQDDEGRAHFHTVAVQTDQDN